MKKGEIHIGTSGWKYKHWDNTFYPTEVKGDAQLAYYATLFNTVELNNSFYRQPSISNFLNWKEAVPKDFSYAVKANRFFTHMKKLKVEANDVYDFIDKVNHLGEKLGPILFQLPPSWKINLDRLAYFLNLLPKGYRYVFEFRNATWYNKAIYELLATKNVAFCIYELDGHLSPLTVTADFVYIRLHGPGAKYQGSYQDKDLETWVTFMRQQTDAGKDVFVYFDNDQAGYAAFNAKRMLELIGV